MVTRSIVAPAGVGTVYDTQLCTIAVDIIQPYLEEIAYFIYLLNILHVHVLQAEVVKIATHLQQLIRNASLPHMYVQGVKCPSVVIVVVHRKTANLEVKVSWQAVSVVKLSETLKKKQLFFESK